MPRNSISSLALALSVTLLLTVLPHGRASARVPPPAPSKNKKKESCATCPAGLQGGQANPLNSLSTLGRRTQQQPFVPAQRSIFDGARVNFVSTSNGSLAFAVTDAKVSGVMPLIFQRAYSSDRAADRGLGAGWSFTYDDRIKVSGDEALLTSGSGAVSALRRVGQSRQFELKTDEPGLHQSFEEGADGNLYERYAGLTRTYVKVGDSHRLARISDANGNAVNISFDARENIVRVAGGGGSLTLEWSGGARARLLSLTDSAGRRTSFAARGGNLASVVAPSGGEWTYGYAGGLLTRAADPLGRVLLRARYDREGRAVEAGDAVGTHQFDYGTNSARRTVVTDPLGAQLTYTHTDLGAMASSTDEEGQAVRIEYDEANRARRVFDSLGNETSFSYDAQHRLLRQSSSDGSARATTYDSEGRVSSVTDGGGKTVYTLDGRGNVEAASGGDRVGSYRARRNGRGQPLSLKSESGRELTFEYDAAGNETAYTFSDVGRYEKKFDAVGRRVSERMPSGLSFEYEYDGHGGVAKVSDNAGRALTVERDAGGLVSRIAAGGVWMRATRDAAGRITRLDSASGKSRHFAYDARGSLTDYTDARGKQRKLKYDRKGRVQSVVSSDGVTFKYKYGRDGNLAAVSREVKAEARAPRFMRAGYNFAAQPFAAPAQMPDYWDGGDGCMFGGDDWYGMDSFYMDNSYSIDNYGMTGMSCDPFGGFGFEGGGGWFEGGGYMGETRQQCIDRHRRACDSDFDACMAVAYGTGVAIIAGCSLATALVGAIVCTALGVVVGSAGMYACSRSGESCMLRAPDGCPS